MHWPERTTPLCQSYKRRRPNSQDCIMNIALVARYTTGSSRKNRCSLCKRPQRSYSAPELAECVSESKAEGFVRNVFQNSSRSRDSLVGKDGNCSISKRQALRTCTDVHQKIVQFKRRCTPRVSRGEEWTASSKQQTGGDLIRSHAA